MSKSFDEEETYYGILMDKKGIADNTCIYIPQYLIKGCVLDDDGTRLFIDELEYTYLMFNDTEIMLSNIENTVGFVISERELLNLYPDCSIDKAKQKYFDFIYKRAYIGFYYPEHDAIKIVNIPLEKTRNTVTDLQSGDKFNIEPLSESDKELLGEQLEENDGASLIVIEANLFKKIMESNDADMREQLNQIYSNYEEMNSHFLDEEDDEQSTIDNDLKENSNIEFQAKKNIVREMKQFFDAKIIGQEEAKKDVISAIIMNQLSDKSRNCCLLVGPTGSGKTLIAETVSEYFNMPMEIIDTTQLTMPGYVGANIEDFLARLLEKSNGDLEKAEKGIIVFDEIDKKGSQSNGDVAGKGVLNTLLPFLQGTTYDVKYGRDTVRFSTSKLTIFATGAFTDVVERKDAKNKTIGFNVETNQNKEKQDIEYKPLEISDFVKYGNMPVEIMGRFTTITQLTGHTKSSLRKILTDSNISALLEEEKKLAKIGIVLFWDDEYLDKVAEEALKLKTGARSLKTIIEKGIKEARWEVLENMESYQAIFLTKDTVTDNLNCQLIDNDNNVIILRDVLSQRTLEKQKIKTLNNPSQ